ncbi:uncharacterized protein F4812DRAFT_408649 [Daldinia caldariorum]|uniref:uncharacterized protein n=1 Tax=Daldinia caldariorum TaxID=326644 RepID=UPI00200820AF|nr:uncharacterized protein F4812DRAFT_408649 [Daldinia caldariorum]KAI1472368.1 hypothetical protein F4812DRAFT_408649 [Daldinia caldariorum]
MFGSSRRHRPPNPPLNPRTADPDATSAAASAFMSASNHKPSRSLSSAAAAAALRARPHTPTNVGEVQTKRTVRRSVSISSAGSSAVPATSSRPTQLKRTSSSSSMVDRTFRSPSPHRAGSIQPTNDRPPVPQIPADHNKPSRQASTGVGMQTFRTASQKIKPGQSSWYTAPSGDPSNVRTSDLPMNTSKPPPLKPQDTPTTSQRPDSRSSSVNFSYPTVFRAQSPPASPTYTQAPQFTGPAPRRPASPPRSNRASISSITSRKSDLPMVYDPNSRRMVPRPAVDNDYYVKETTEKQSRKKKYSGAQKEGNYVEKATGLGAGGVIIDAGTSERDPPEVQNIDALPGGGGLRPLEGPEINATTTASDQRVQDPEELDNNYQPSPIQDAHVSTIQGPSVQPISDNLRRDSPHLETKPGVVADEPEDVSDEDDAIAHPSRKALEALDAVPTRQFIFEQPQDLSSSSKSARVAVQQDQTDRYLEQAHPEPDHVLENKSLSGRNKPAVEVSGKESYVRRSTSNSPARQTRFSAAPSSNLAVRHTPLPRSASPIKSALKRTSSTSREVSPSEKGSDASRSRGVSPPQDESTAPRKKSVRVSFDDRTMATVVGESAGDIDDSGSANSVQAKRPWYSNIGRSKRREFALDDDEIMKPRPALPSFGSVREKKPRELEERPLVRPHELTQAPGLRPSGQHTSSNSRTSTEMPLGQSSGQAISSDLGREQIPRNAPNISRFREPLPPVVTSVEGSGYISDSVEGTDSDDDLLNSIGGASDTEDFPNTQITQPDTPDNSQNDSTILEKRHTNSEVNVPNAIHVPPHDIPEIAITQPSPRVPEQGTSAASVSEEPFFDVPGRFPDDGSEKLSEVQTTPEDNNSKANGDISLSSPIFEPKATVHPVQPETLPQTTLATTAPLDSTDNGSTDDSDESIYSDAYEDPWEAGGDGFLSLNAVVEKPIEKLVPPELPDNASQKPYENYQPQRVGDIASTSKPEQHQDDWEQAKAFWRSLTAEKRLQLEREAMEEAGVQGDEDEVERPVRKNSVKKAASQKRLTAEAQLRTSTQQAEHSLSANSIKVSTERSRPKATQEPSNQPAPSSRMRMSLREGKPARASDGMRKTMRPQAAGGANQSSRLTTQKEKPTPASSKPTQHVQQITPELRINRTSSSFPTDEHALQRRGSDASDSSFKRNRATRSSGFGLRSSMRPSSANPAQDITRGSGRFSLRSLSPTGSAFRQSLPTKATGGVATPTMRRTLRSSSVSSQDKTRPSIHFPSFGRPNKNHPTKPSKKSSRFGDSSDEDEGGIAGFRSRFDDSSDDESVRPRSSEPGPLSRGTLRGSAAGTAGFRKSTPVPEVDEGSPALPDNDENMPSPMRTPRSKASVSNIGLTRSNSEALGTTTLTRSRSGRGGFDTSISTPTTPNRERRSSLMGILRRNKRVDSASKIQRSGLVESAARRDTRLERSNEQLKDLRSENSSNLRLQKRSSVRNDSWPLGEPAGNEGMKRSDSAGNLLNGSSTDGPVQRPELNGRRTTSLGLPAAYENEGDDVIDETGHKKKKKFGTLRRMFGLDD